jgi:phosphate transport system substrate-binding protein
MWQKENQDNSIFNLALLLALATIPMVGSVTAQQSALAQSATNAPSSPARTTVPTNTAVRIDGSSSMAVINQTLKQHFEKQFSGTTVDVAANGADAALKALQEGKIDLAAINRELTPEEKAQGLEQILLRRDKIAVVVSKDNPFKGVLNPKRFAKIFRGEITNWVQVGGPEGKIRFLDHPSTNDMREALRGYPVFQNAKFATGSNATTLEEKNLPELAKQLGKDGITYIPANQVSKLQDIRAVSMNHILPQDPRYPFSLASVYVYKKNPGRGVGNFLDFATTPLGQQAIEEAINAEATAIASGKPGVTTTASTPPTPEVATSNVTASATGSASPSAVTTNTPHSTSIVSSSSSTQGQNTSGKNQSFLANKKSIAGEGIILILWWLLPLFALGGFILWWLRGRHQANKQAEEMVESTLNILSQEAFAADIPSTNVTNHQHSSSDLIEHSTPVTSAVASQINGGGTALTDGQVLTVGTSSPLWLKFFERVSAAETTNTEKTALQSGEVLADEQPEVAEATASLKQPNVAVDLDAPVTVVHSQPSERSDTYTKSDVAPTEVSTAHEVAAYEAIAPNVAASSSAVTLTTTTTEQPTPVVEEQANDTPIADAKSHIVLTPRTHKWAYAYWEVSEYKKQALRQQGGTQLMLRLYDVTNIDLNYQSPQQIQQYECEETIHDRYVAIPTSDRDYMAEIGYVTKNKGWLLLARSSSVHVAKRPEENFWFIADAELIIHGAAEPGATVSIDGHTIKTKPDGTFHLRIPFTDKSIDYAMTAVPANGEQAKTIHMQFSQGNKE